MPLRLYATGPVRPAADGKEVTEGMDALTVDVVAAKFVTRLGQPLALTLPVKMPLDVLYDRVHVVLATELFVHAVPPPAPAPGPPPPGPPPPGPPPPG